MSEKITVAVDLMGADQPAAELLKGVYLAMERDPDVRYVLVGKEQEIRAAFPENAPELEIVDAPSVILTEEDPMLAIRRKRDSSMITAFKLLKDKKVDAVVSAGSTGAFLAGALFTVGRIKGIHRPALAPVFPTKGEKGVLLVDCGANAECTPEFLLQFARMGAIYMRYMFDIGSPRVGLINNGAEAEKGTTLYKETHKLLEESPLNFIGNVEPRNLPNGEADVLVCDGFSGNMVLKSYEGAIQFLFSMLKGEFARNLLTKLATAILMPGLKRIKNKLDYNKVGGAPLIGIDGCVVKAHGSSDGFSFSNALMQAVKIARSGVVEAIKKDIESLA